MLNGGRTESRREKDGVIEIGRGGGIAMQCKLPSCEPKCLDERLKRN